MAYKKRDRSYMNDRVALLKERFKKVFMLESRSLQELAIFIGVSYPTLLNFIHGVRIPNSNVLKRFEKYIVQMELEVSGAAK